MTKQLIAYFLLSCFISWAIWLPLYGHVFGLNNLTDIPFNHGIGGFGPFLSTFLVTWIYHGKMKLLPLVKGLCKVKPIIYVAIALLSPFMLGIAAKTISSLIEGVPINLSGSFISSEFPDLNFVQFFIYNFVCFGVGEETGWRGFLLPRLQSKYNALTSSIIVTAFWALWHLPVFLYNPNFIAMNIGDVFGWIFSLLTGSILLTWLYNSSRASILVCSIFHTTINISFSTNSAGSITLGLMGFLITLWSILIIRYFKSNNLSKNNRIVIRL